MSGDHASVISISASPSTARKGGGPYVIPLTPSVMSLVTGVVTFDNGARRTLQPGDVTNSDDWYSITEPTPETMTAALAASPMPIKAAELQRAVERKIDDGERTAAQVMFPATSGMTKGSDKTAAVNNAVDAIIKSAEFTHRGTGEPQLFPELKPTKKITLASYQALWNAFLPVFKGAEYVTGDDGERRKIIGVGRVWSAVESDFFVDARKKGKSPAELDRELKKFLVDVLIDGLGPVDAEGWSYRYSCALAAWCVSAVFAYLSGGALKAAMSRKDDFTAAKEWGSLRKVLGGGHCGAYAFLGEVAVAVYTHVCNGMAEHGVPVRDSARCTDFVVAVDSAKNTHTDIHQGIVVRLASGAKRAPRMYK